MLLSASNITKYHNDKCILDDVAFTIEEQDKIALIGVNGTGKSTFLKIVAGVETYEGKIIRKNGLKISYLAQEPDFKDYYTILEQVQEKVDMKKVEEYEIKSVLTKLGIIDFSLKISQLSGGQKKRVALGIALLETCDLLILDEPTNHLDNDMIEWLEKYLMKLKKAVLMVTHDRYFLDRITQKILEIDRSKIYSYDANYSLFLEEKAKREENALAQERKRNHSYVKKLNGYVLEFKHVEQKVKRE